MLSTISWEQFFMVIGGATLVWVLYVLRLHHISRRRYEPDIEADESPPAKRVWSVQDPAATPTHQTPSPAGHQAYMPPPFSFEHLNGSSDTKGMQQAEDEGEYLALEQMAMEIGDITAQLGISTSEDTLLDTLRQTLDKYPTLSADHHRQAISKLIARCSLQDCGITLSPDQLDSLWATNDQDNIN